MTDPGYDREKLEAQLNHASFGLSGPAFCFALLLKYAGLTIYGIGSIVFEVPTFVTIGSSFFAIAWASLVTLFAGFAVIGVARTWRTGKFQLEKSTTAAFVLTFTGYSFALAYRAITQEDFGSLPLAIIPIVVVILPTVRYYSLVSRRGVNFRRRNA